MELQKKNGAYVVQYSAMCILSSSIFRLWPEVSAFTLSS